MSPRMRLRAPIAALFLFAAALGLTGAPSASASEGAVSDTDAAAFIDRLGNRAIEALTDPALEPAVRRDRFRDLLRKGLDLRFVSEFVLGAYRRRASADQLERFRALLEDNIVQNYAWRFRNYNGETFEIRGVREASRGARIVDTRVGQSGEAPPLRVEWRVHDTDGTIRIIDIAVEGISMMVTQRDEYVGFMRANGGIEALIDALARQNESMAERYEDKS